MNIALAIREGLQMIAEEMRNNRESQERDKLEGYLTDEDKIRMLKIDLYKRSRCGFLAESDVKYIEQLRKTIALLSNEIDYKRQRDYSLVTILNEGARTFLGLGMLAVVASYAVQWSGACKYVNSEFCRNSRIIPNAVERYFYDEPALVNPERFNVNIDQSK